MGRRVDIDDLIDAQDVAALLGLSQPNNVHLYQRRYPDMPRPVLDRGGRRAKLWLRSEIKAWIKQRETDSGTGVREGSGG
jgi:glutathione-regulated potassium-efflux system ancillary protein KefG